MMRARILQLLRAAVERCEADGVLPPGAAARFVGELRLERPRQEAHGDYACAAALAMGKALGRNPRQLAEALAAAVLAADGTAGARALLASVDVAGPGFLNVRARAERWDELLGEVRAAGAAWGRSDVGGGERVNLEYVSANPTGPMHVGHGRGAAIGSALARLLDLAGWRVTTEFYVNDRGNQVWALGRSVLVRYLQRLGRPAAGMAEAEYPGEYVNDIAARLVEAHGEAFAGVDPADRAALKPVRDFAVAAMLERLRSDLDAFGVRFDVWTSEQALADAGAIDRAVEALRARGRVETREEGKLWFVSGAPSAAAPAPAAGEAAPEEAAADDWVLKKADGEWTYLASDLAYHADKVQRGFARLIDIWGADHHGHIPRVARGLEAFGHDPAMFEVLLVQFVRLKGGRMGKRTGQFVMLSDLIDEVGRDAARFFFLMRRADSQLEFDLDLAVAQTLDNPVYHAQYGHARCCSILGRAREVFAGPLGEVPPPAADAPALALAEERALVRALGDFPDVIAGAARAREPHRVVTYLSELSQAFQSYYTYVGKSLKDPILPQKRDRETPGWEARWDWGKARARLALVDGVRQVLAAALGVAGVSAPERMERAEAEDEQADA
ncbi:MAG TPA: arginine--tRNA ligase [Myxococcota bacterium]|jgi:arginyl-tRNA synthetase|nr:arginine--tRNA ligase [Myxococcota bacterium]